MRVKLTDLFRKSKSPSDDSPESHGESATVKQTERQERSAPASHAATRKARHPTAPSVAHGLLNVRCVLIWLSRFGWLTARQIARLCWTDAADPMAAAFKALRKYVAAGVIEERKLPNRYRALTLTQAGADYLATVGIAGAKSGKDLLRHAGPRDSWFHRWVANEYLIESHLLNVNRFYTEYEIYGHRSPLSEPYRRLGHKVMASWLGKIPDGLVVERGNATWQSFEWVEVENSKRRKSDAYSLARFLIRGLHTRSIDQGRLQLFNVTLLFPYCADQSDTVADVQSRIQWITRALDRAAADYAKSDTDLSASDLKNQVYPYIYIVMMDVTPQLRTRHVARIAALDYLLEDGIHGAVHRRLIDSLRTDDPDDSSTTWLVDEDRRVYPGKP